MKCRWRTFLRENPEKVVRVLRMLGMAA